MSDLNQDFSIEKKIYYPKSIKTNLEYERIVSRTDTRVICMIEYWWPKKKEQELYKTDQEFAEEIGVSTRSFQYSKKRLSKKLKFFSTRSSWRNGKKVTYYGPLNYEKIECLLDDKNTTQKRKNCILLDECKTQKLRQEDTKTALCTLYTNNTTNITFNPASLEKNELSLDQSELRNLPSEQKPMGVETAVACRNELILDQTPTLEKEQYIQEEKAVETPSNYSLKAEDVAAPKESKATKKATKAKPAKVIKTRINRNLELTPERRQIGLNARFLNRGLVEGVIETEFESFVDYFTETGTLRSDWDLSWKNWCKKAIELDKYHRKTIENPIRSGTTVTASTEEKVSIDSAFAGFVKEKLNGMQFDFEGATYAEVDGRIVIDQQNSFRRDQIEKLKDKLEKHFGKEIELKWLRNSWVIPTVSKQETEIVASDVSVLSSSPSPLCVEEIPLETPPLFETWALLQESSKSSGIDKSLKILFEAMQERSRTLGEFKINRLDCISCEQENPLTEEKNDKKTAEKTSDENQFNQSEQQLESNPVMISSPVEAGLVVDQPQPNENLQENRSEISITQLCLEFNEEISTKPVEEEIQLEVREEVNNLPSPRTSSTIDLATSHPSIKLSKPKSALHLPKFPVATAKSFSDFPSTAKRLSDYAEMIRANLINARLEKKIPPGLAKTAQESSFKPQSDIIPAEVVNAIQAVKNNQFEMR